MPEFTTTCKTCNEIVRFKDHPVPRFEHIHFAMHETCGSIWYMAEDYESGVNIDLTPQHIEAIVNEYGIEGKIVD